MALALATMFVSTSFANTVIFHVTKNDIDDYGEESIQIQTKEGALVIYAVNLTDEQGQTLAQAKPGVCLVINSPDEIIKDEDYYVIDQIANVVTGPCNESFNDIGTGCLLNNNRTLTLDNIYSNPVYSYGKPGNPEITLSAGIGNTAVFKGQDMFSGGGASYLRFTNGKYSYVAYSGMGKGWNFEGLMVYNGSDLIAHHACQNNNNLFAGIDFDQIQVDTDTADFVFAPE